MQYGGTFQTVKKLIKLYGNNAKNELLQHPYDVGTKVGLSLNCCDRLSNSSDKHTDERMRVLLNSAMSTLLSSGHTYVTQKQLIDAAKKKYKTETIKEELSELLATEVLKTMKNFCVEYDKENRYFLKHTRNAEINIVKNISRLQRTSIDVPYTIELRDEVATNNGVTLGEDQARAFELLGSTGLKILTGGPGTGKTTTINTIIQVYEKLFPDNIIKLCAPTGRAAQRMKESTGREAVTVHRLLEFCPYGENIKYKNENDPIEADFIVVDEVSMLDNELTSMLLSATKDGTMVFFVGDINQLPSVGAGNVLEDLIASEKIDVRMLNKVFRQASDSPIIGNAYKINNGETDFKLTDDFIATTDNDVIELQKTLITNAQKYWDKDNPFYMQILSPTHKGEAGTDEINAILQDKLNPEKDALYYGKKKFKVNDKVITLHNNYEVGYFNGDIGIIREIKDGTVTVVIGDKEVDIDNSNMDDLDLAYAITIHKSQGSEFPVTIISLPMEPAVMLNRNLLYTAVTRAKKVAIINGEQISISKAIYSTSKGCRQTRLKQRLMAM